MTGKVYLVGAGPGDPSLITLRAVELIKKRIKNVPGLVDLTDDFDRSRPELKVVINREQ